MRKIAPTRHPTVELGSPSVAATLVGTVSPFEAFKPAADERFTFAGISDRYTSTSVLSSGGHGVVFRATGERSGTEVAVKVATGALTFETNARFAREREIALALKHRNVVGANDYGVIFDSRPFLVMPLVTGPTLDEAKQPQSWSEAREQFLQLCSGVDYVHKKSIVHRDIKPKNVIVTPDGVVKLLDFGIALAAHHRRITLPGTFIGSVGHSSLDHVFVGKGDPTDALPTPHPKDDIVSLGIILYELVTNHSPWVHICSAYDKIGVIPKLLYLGSMDDQMKLELKINIALHVPPELREVIGRALEPDRSRRYDSVEELVKGVLAVMGDFELPFIPDRLSFPPEIQGMLIARDK